jgi:hypothetical protein
MGPFSHPIEGEKVFEVKGSEGFLSAYGEKWCEAEARSSVPSRHWPGSSLHLQSAKIEGAMPHLALVSDVHVHKVAKGGVSEDLQHGSQARVSLCVWGRNNQLGTIGFRLRVLGLRLAPLEAAGAASRAVCSDVEREFVAL